MSSDIGVLSLVTSRKHEFETGHRGGKLKRERIRQIPSEEDRILAHGNIFGKIRIQSSIGDENLKVFWLVFFSKRQNATES